MKYCDNMNYCNCKLKARLKTQAIQHINAFKNDGMSKIYNGTIQDDNTLLSLAKEINNKNIKGGSLLDNLDKITQYVQLGTDIYKAAQKYENELHIPLYVNGTIRLANYMGPYTNLYTRLANNDRAISYADNVSKLHDINYELSKLAENKTEQHRLIREADELMIQQIQAGKQFNLDNRLNLLLASGGISTKLKVEDLNIPIISSKLQNIAGDLTIISHDNIQLLNNARNETLNEINQSINQ